MIFTKYFRPMKKTLIILGATAVAYLAVKALGGYVGNGKLFADGGNGTRGGLVGGGSHVGGGFTNDVSKVGNGLVEGGGVGNG